MLLPSICPDVFSQQVDSSQTIELGIIITAKRLFASRPSELDGDRQAVAGAASRAS